MFSMVMSASVGITYSISDISFALAVGFFSRCRQSMARRCELNHYCFYVVSVPATKKVQNSYTNSR